MVQLELSIPLAATSPAGRCHLRYEHTIEPLEKLAEVAREGTQVAHVNVRNVSALIARDLHGLMNRSERRSPADNRKSAMIVTKRDVLKWDVARNPGDLIGARLGHAGVIVGVVRDVSGVVIALEPADAMLELRRPRFDPGPRQGLRVAQERMKSFRIGPIADGEFRQIGFPRNPRSEEHTSELQSRLHLVC